MKLFETLPHRSEIGRRLLACAVTAAIVLPAVILAPPIDDSIVTLESSRALTDRLDSGEPPRTGIDVSQTTAVAVEPLSMAF